MTQGAPPLARSVDGPLDEASGPAAAPVTEEAAAFVRRYLRRDDIRQARFVTPVGSKKNQVADYWLGDDHLVLKVFQQAVRYTLQVLKNPVSRYVSRAFTIRSRAASRAQAEVDGIEGFRKAGFGTFELVGRPHPRAVVLRFAEGEPLRRTLRRAHDVELTRRYVERLASDLGRRQEIACREDDLRMIHPAPRLQHVWIGPSDELLYYDFEDRVNPHLPVQEAAARELQSFFFYLWRSALTLDPETIALAREAVGDSAMERWKAHERAFRYGISGSARRRQWVLPAVLDA